MASNPVYLPESGISPNLDPLGENYFKWTAANGDDVDLSDKQEFTVVMKTPLHACMITATERIGQMGSNMLALIFRIGVKWVLKSQEL
ncbi:hypothetical protein RJ639_020001 [Escallonia herrerae]|uniref:Uncharacterized protein n=1 Tax=Escallonia herrerae TaxID=1293975 RepID=A0AA88V924_9ASTE|nr:hypothetical protein RJ639_020001 [Escallonia herrerae]